MSWVTDWECVGVGGTNDGSGTFAPWVLTAPIARTGYRFVASDGGIFSYGAAQFYGTTGSIVLNKPIVGISG